MISEKTIKSLEFDKILQGVSEYAVLERTKKSVCNFSPLTELNEVKNLLKKTEEAYDLLFKYSIGGVYYFADVSDSLKRADTGGVLNNSELLKIADNLKSARLIKTAIDSVSDDKIDLLRTVSDRLIVNSDFEKEITSKIVSEDEVADNASPRLASIRKSIRDLNAHIREKLNSYIRGYGSKYLQDAVVTMRQGRYVIPVKSENRSQIRGFIHDQSSSGATVFIEPEAVMEGNNELKKALFDEKEEIYNILSDLSKKVVFNSDAIRYNAENLEEIDAHFARANYAFYKKCVKPVVNDKGVTNIKKGRHPLIDSKVVVPVSLKLGKDYNFLLLTGPNTGGKTVTLKLTGLFSLMAMSGMYIPAEEESEVSVFSGVFSDIGDEQSIEQNLSTFSSHFKNLIYIIDNLDEKSLVLLDEIGAGTDPDEGSALALAVIETLLSAHCFGIITTHYSKLKEFAMNNDGIENASMEFNSETLKPLYKVNIGIPGSSNAIEIAKTLGMAQSVINKAYLHLSDKQIGFEKVLKKAEENRLYYEKISDELETIKKEKEAELKVISEEKEKIAKEREKIYFNAKQETKRIVADKLSEAEEIIDELKKILKKADLESKEVFRASSLKNRLANSRYLSVDESAAPHELVVPKENELVAGNKVYVKSLNGYAKILSIKQQKKEAEVIFGDIKTKVKFSDLYNSEKVEEAKAPVTINRKTINSLPKTELNVVGKNSDDALEELKYFIDRAIVDNLSEIKVIHGIGEGILLKNIRNYLKNDKNVKEFRRGKYGEGENGVTIITLK